MGEDGHDNELGPQQVDRSSCPYDLLFSFSVLQIYSPYWTLFLLSPRFCFVGELNYTWVLELTTCQVINILNFWPGIKWLRVCFKHTPGLSQRLVMVAMEPTVLVDTRRQQGTLLFHIQSDPSAESLRTLHLGHSCPTSGVLRPQVQNRACMQRSGSQPQPCLKE